MEVFNMFPLYLVHCTAATKVEGGFILGNPKGQIEKYF